MAQQQWTGLRLPDSENNLPVRGFAVSFPVISHSQERKTQTDRHGSNHSSSLIHFTFFLLSGLRCHCIAVCLFFDKLQVHGQLLSNIRFLSCHQWANTPLNGNSTPPGRGQVISIGAGKKLASSALSIVRHVSRNGHFLSIQLVLQVKGELYL